VVKKMQEQQKKSNVETKNATTKHTTNTKNVRFVGGDSRMIPVIIETPFKGNKIKNMKYLRSCMRDCLMRGEAPFASHGLYTQNGVLNDNISEERELGIKAGFIWAQFAEKIVVYTDLGISEGMERGIKNAKQKIEYRKLNN